MRITLWLDLTLKILVMLPYLPNQINVSTIITNNVLNAIKKKVTTNMIWILQMPKPVFDNIYKCIEIHPFQNYNDACDILDKTKPDVIFTEISYAYSSYPLIVAGKYMKIPIVGYVLYDKNYLDFSFDYSRSKIFTSKITRFFSNKTNNKSDKQILGRGRFYLLKYRFLLKTLRATKVTIWELLQNIFENIWVNTIGIMNKDIDKRLAVDVICLNNDSWINSLIQAGFDKKSLVITGSPLYDNHKIDSIRARDRHTNDRIRILFVTTPLYSHGQWSKNQQKDFVKRVISELKKYENSITFDIKIHPTSEEIEFYKEIIQEMHFEDISIFQHDKLNELLQNYDLAISFGRFSTSHLDILLSRVPLIIISEFYESKEIFVLKYGLALECASISSLAQKIEESINFCPSDEDLANFCNVFSKPFDGLAANRIADVILQVANKTNDTVSIT